MPMDFDRHSLPNVSGDVLAFALQDPDVDPNTVLEIDKDWKVRVEWHAVGTGAHNLAGADWHVTLKIESMGGGDEKTLKSVTVPGTGYVPGSTPTHVHYSTEIPIQARVPGMNLPDRINQDGVYRLIAIVTHDKVGGFPGPDRVAGFIEGPMLQFYSFK